MAFSLFIQKSTIKQHNKKNVLFLFSDDSSIKKKECGDIPSKKVSREVSIQYSIIKIESSQLWMHHAQVVWQQSDSLNSHNEREA